MKRSFFTINSNANWQLDSWQVLMILRLMLPYVGLIAAFWLFWNHSVSPVDLSILALFTLLTRLGYTVGYHRLFTHRSFETTQPVRILLAILGLMGSPLTITEYVAIHRCHHAFSDRPGDPHSPHMVEGKGLVKMIRGMWHAHSGWFFQDNLNLKEKIRKYAADLLKDPLIANLDRLYYLWLVLGLVLPAFIGFFITLTWTGALTALIFGGLFRMFLIDQIEFWGRGSDHYSGQSPLEAEGFNQWSAIFTLGEWHNNHHAFPHSANQGFEAWQLDLSYLMIVTLEKLGLANKVKRVSPQEINYKRVKI